MKKKTKKREDLGKAIRCRRTAAIVYRLMCTEIGEMPRVFESLECNFITF